METCARHSVRCTIAVAAFALALGALAWKQRKPLKSLVMFVFRCRSGLYNGVVLQLLGTGRADTLSDLELLARTPPGRNWVYAGHPNQYWWTSRNGTKRLVWVISLKWPRVGLLATALCHVVATHRVVFTVSESAGRDTTLHDCAWLVAAVRALSWVTGTSAMRAAAWRAVTATLVCFRLLVGSVERILRGTDPDVVVVLYVLFDAAPLDASFFVCHLRTPPPHDDSRSSEGKPHPCVRPSSCCWPHFRAYAGNVDTGTGKVLPAQPWKQ